jgi:Nucleotidyl transferase AbiEii toxin, Type IV TA system
MKDFHDLLTLCTTFTFDGQTLAEAIRATFKQRGTELPMEGVPLAFTAEFCEDESKVKQWAAFCNKNKSYVQQTELKDIVTDLASFLVPVINSVKQGTVFRSTWTRADTWHFSPNQ